MKKANKLILLMIMICFLLVGCSNNQLIDENKERVVNPETGQALQVNILCRPTDESILELYEQHAESLEFKLEELPRCSVLKITGSSYTGLYDSIFVIPLAWYIIRIASIVGNYGLAVMLVGLMIRIVLTPLQTKTIKQSENMKKAQPELNNLEKKYKDKKDNESMMKKSQEMMMIYKKYNISPIGSCLMSFLQLPLFLAFLSAINRTPAIFEENLWGFQLGTTPGIGIFQQGNYFYIILIILVILTTYVSFKFNMSSTGNSDQQKQMKFMVNFMLVFISVASFSLPTAIGLYWIITNGYSVVLSLFIRKKTESK